MLCTSKTGYLSNAINKRTEIEGPEKYKQKENWYWNLSIIQDYV